MQKIFAVTVCSGRIRTREKTKRSNAIQFIDVAVRID